MLKQGWSMYSDYKYQRSNVKISVRENKAYVSADLKESMTVQGQNISGDSREEVKLEMVNGKILITDIVGYISM